MTTTPQTRRFAAQANDKFWMDFHEWLKIARPTTPEKQNVELLRKFKKQK